MRALALACLMALAPMAMAEDLCVRPFAGNGEDDFSGDGGPALQASISDFLWGVTVGPGGDIYFVDGLFRIRKIDAASGIISTVVGSGEESYNGDEIPATEAWIDDPRQIVFDAAGNMYFADDENLRVRKVDTSGIIHTVAGNGLLGFSGDGGPATSARLKFPHGVALDSAGNLYIADTFNQIIRKVDTFGVITTVAGTWNVSGFAGDGLSATAATFALPNSLAVDAAGTIYVNDSGNNRIRKIATNGVISTYVGNGTAGFSGDGGPAYLAEIDGVNHISLDSAGNLYLADRYNHRIRKVDLISGNITTVAGTGGTGYTGDLGPALSAQLPAPLGVAVNAAGDLFISDFSHIRKVDATTQVISNYAGWEDGALAVEASVNAPSGVFFDDDENAYILDTFNQRIRMVSHATKQISTFAGNGLTGDTGDGGPATEATFNYPSAAVRDEDNGDVYVADSENHKVRKIDGTSGIITTYAGNGTAGSFGDGGAATSANLDTPSGLAFDSLGNLYIACTNSNSIRKVDKLSGIITKVAGTSYAGYNGDGPDGAHAALNGPTGLACEDDNDLFIADTGNHRIRKLSLTSGFISTVAGNGLEGKSGNGASALGARLSYPQGVAFSDGEEVLYIADTGNSQIRTVGPDGKIRLLAGTGEVGYAGDLGPAELAKFDNPQAVNIDEDGEVWISDTFNDRVRRLKPCPATPEPAINATRAEVYHNLFYPGRGEQVTLSYDLESAMKVRIRVFDLKGREIVALVDQQAAPRGIYRTTWDGRGTDGTFAASGLYLVRFELGSYAVLKKVVLVR